MAGTPKPLPVLAGVYYARIEGQIEGEPCGNTLAFEKIPNSITDPSDAASALLVAQALAVEWPIFAGVVMNEGYVANLVSVYPLGSPLVPAQEAGMIAIGGVTGPLAGLKLAKLVSKRTAKRGRGSTGHSYIGAVTASEVDAGGIIMTSAAYTALDTAYQALIDNTIGYLIAHGDAPTWREVTVSKVGVGNAYQVTNNSAQHTLSTQRKRVR